MDHVMKPVPMSKKLKKVITADNNGWKITQPLYDYLTRYPDNGSLVDKQMAKVLVTLAAKKTGTRAGAFHPSQLHTCERSQVFGYLGVPGKAKQFSPELINLFNDGTWRHIRWQITLLQAGIITDVEVPVNVPHYRLMGSIDGVHRPERWMLELKGTAQFQSVVLYGAMPQHIQQVHGYLVGDPTLEMAVILYEDKTTNAWHEVLIPRRRTIIKEIEGTLNELNSSVAHQKLPRVLPECQRGEGAYRSCAYAYLCKQVDWPEAEDAAGCDSSDEVYVKLGIKRRNTHQARTGPTRKQGTNLSSNGGTPVLVRNADGTLGVRRRATREN